MPPGKKHRLSPTEEREREERDQLALPLRKSAFPVRRVDEKHGGVRCENAKLAHIHTRPQKTGAH